MIHKLIFGLFITVISGVIYNHKDWSINPQNNAGTLTVKNSTDFEITGKGSADNWAKAEWTIIPQRLSSGESLTTKVKTLYSETGIYFLFDCQDKKLTAAMNSDFMDLWKEDVVEVFLWTDESTPVYFEYEISPLNYELPILISNFTSNQKEDIVRWQPFHYDPDRKTRHATDVQGSEKKSNAIISGWTAEFFIPFKLLRPLNNISPKPGTKWRTNIYRMDYDNKRASWSWQLTSRSFHEFEKFGILLFD